MNLSVIFASPEATPFAKTGGLADVAGSLPGALKALGAKVFIFLPFYRHVANSGMEIEPTALEVTVPIGRRTIKARVLRNSKTEVPAYFIKCDEYYDRTYLYGTPDGDYFDNIERFAFFSRAVLEAIKAGGFRPDIIHCNDWQTGLIPAYLKDAYKKDEYFSKTATVLTVHNTAYQGVFPPELYDVLDLSKGLFSPEGLEFWGSINLLKAGVVFSDAITTVSPGYSREIRTPQYGYGLDGLFNKRGDDLYGVVNGADYNEWNPSTDPLIPGNYSPDDLSGKGACKRELLKAFDLDLEETTPVIGMISRLAGQKGFDILAEAMPALMRLNLGIVILGTGETVYRGLIEKLAEKYPRKLSVKIAFDNTLAHLVEAGSDIFLMPSRYEPCGLNQLYSMRYGTIPVVRATGGLDDTVRDFGEEGATGFKFKEYSAAALASRVKDALAVFRNKKAWSKLQKNAMAEDFSWEKSAKNYMEIYRKALKKTEGNFL
ncbi:MAG TPA: glycogen synthase GlgA [Thermodesulfobacteriota bacterium]|nr:glycogen synthase GlgA [Thermodesulfobacteriota bacterium]